MENDLTLANESLATTTGSKPKIYSKKAVLYFSFFCSPVFGAALILANLWPTRKRSVGFAVLFLAVVYNYLVKYINPELLILTSRYAGFIFKFSGAYILITWGVGFIFNFIGAYILTEYVHAKFFPDETEYEKKGIRLPLAIAIGLFLLGLAFLLFYVSLI